MGSDIIEIHLVYQLKVRNIKVQATCILLYLDRYVSARQNLEISVFGLMQCFVKLFF